MRPTRRAVLFAAASLVAALPFAAGCSAPPAAARAPHGLRTGVAMFAAVDPLAQAQQIAAMGFDYIEPGLAKAVALPPAERAAAPAKLAALGLRAETMNWFLPPELKVTGPAVDTARVRAYVEQALATAQSFGAEVIVFGSPASRSSPDGFPRERAWQQLREFLTLCGDVIDQHHYGMVIAIEALRRPETNLVNTTAEAIALARSTGHAKVRVVVDFYHLTFEHEDPAVMLQAADLIVHTQISEPAARGYPRSDAGDKRYAAFFAVLQRIGYRGRISLEGAPKDFAADAPAALTFLRAATAR